LLTHLPIDDRAVQYGDGLFETIAVRAGRPRLWSWHMNRLASGCERLRLDMPNPDRLLARTLDAVQQAKVNQQYCLVKILLSAGSGQRGYGRTAEIRPRVLVGVFAATPQPKKHYQDGVNTLICDTRLASGSPTAGLKTLNRLEQVLARSECAESDCFDAFTMDAEDNIICGTMSNVFFVHGDTIHTPRLDQCGVRGVMRSWLVENLPAHGFDMQQRRLPKSELPDIDEVFLANSQFAVLPVRRCGDRTWSVGRITRKVMALLREHDVVEGP